MHRTFTWDGVAVPWIADTDTWTAGELRQVEALAGGTMGDLSMTSVRGFMICVSVARATGQRIAVIDAQLTLGRIDAIRDELAAQDREEAERLAAAAAEPESTGRVVEFTGTVELGVTGTQHPAGDEPGEVLSPTSAGSEQPPA